jgi:hypothetical protein
MRELGTFLPNLEIIQQKTMIFRHNEGKQKKIESKRFQLVSMMQKDIPL